MRLAIPRFSCRYGYLLCQISRGISVLSGLGRPTPLQPTVPSVGGSVTPGSRRILHCGVRNLYRIAIRSPSRVSVRSRLTLIPPYPDPLSVVQEPLGFRCARFPRALSLLMPTFSFHAAPAHLPVNIHRRHQCSPTDPCGSHVFGAVLYARSSSTRHRSTSELLRTL